MRRRPVVILAVGPAVAVGGVARGWEARAASPADIPGHAVMAALQASPVGLPATPAVTPAGLPTMPAVP